MRNYGFGPFAGGCDWSLFYTTPGGIIMMIVLAVVIGLLIYIAVTRRSGNNTIGYDRYHEPANIARRRFAEGAITKEELDRILETLGTR
jgi:uncharacterized membrane protein